MTTNYRALCAELLDELDLWSSWHDAPDLKARTKAALAQLEPEGPTDEELLQLAREWNSGHESIDLDCIADYAREVLARYGGSTSSSIKA